MKKLLTLLLSAVLVVGSCFYLTACNKPDPTPTPTPTPQTEISYTAAPTQLDALTSLTTESADATIVDASFLSYFNKRSPVQLKAITQSAVSFSKQSYAFAVQKDSNVALYLNAALYELQENGTLEDIAKAFDVANVLIDIPEPEVTFDNLPTPEKDSVWANIVKRGYLKVATVYDEGQKSPFLHMSQYGSADGFEIKILIAISQLFGLDVHKQPNAENEYFLEEEGEISFDTLDQAFVRLDSSEIDVVINRLNAEKVGSASVDFTINFCSDTQVLVATNSDWSVDDLKTKKFTAGKNSIGESLIKNQLSAYYFGK